MKTFAGRTAVITGAGSGFGLEVARLCAARGMRLVLVDVQADALDRASTELRGAGADTMAERVDVSNAAAMERLAASVAQRFGAPSLVFNNAGIGAGGLIWENTLKDWEWVLGVNLMGVIHGVRLFTPMMLEAERRDPSYEGHIVNTASMAGLVNMPNMGVYNVSKHAVVSLSETLYQDLRLVSDRIGASVLCPFFVPTGITASDRNRPDTLKDDRGPTKSQLIGRAMSEKAVTSGKVTAAQVAQFVLDAVEEGRFYVYSHPRSLASVQTRIDDIVQSRNPSDPFAARPEIGAALRAQLRAAD
jgi:NAD(P)-dependent dehydrogenase (short-subunit alcohol dehydrogenase family)